MVDKHFDTDKFIEIVRARPVVWDINSDDYASRTLKKDAWNELLHLVINDFDIFSEEHKEKASEYNLLFLFYS
jgi:ATP adenylyltransferase/5',5'''-P-1,P-4-tetraphosphate phosphorylase II